eukprot:CAMPEP_0181322030 /NCGR_PEP_ID=MMETSP1101-20121128/19012_1 /TAXON_ID=46948 /ORGANISM="Rhodomonas abbreviata, Strain Caron Lab Isolate" /LENGTH=873 /DNA_ID=CAMNT_0023429919 /DNA_START=18 /DNA_END=2636 /DNA_ORIENTATION=-
MSQQHAKSSGLLGRLLLAGEEPREVEVPLVGVKVKGEVHDFIAEVKVQQSFYNPEATDLEGVYHFPLDEASAVCAFQADYEDGAVVEAVVKEKEEARNEYEMAVKCGKQAQLLESVRPDIFTITVGRIPPGKHVSVTITYITMLKAEGSAARFLLPTHIAERYSPVSGSFSPPIPTIPTSAAKFFGLDFNIKFKTSSPIKALTSPTHQGDIVIACSGASGEVTLTNVSLTKDLVILCEESNPHQPRACLEIDKDGGVAGLVTLFPEIEFKDVPREIIFVIDRSGSMGAIASPGKTQMDEAREALQLFLRSLPPSCTFNIVGFGSRFDTLFRTPSKYDDSSLAAASEYVRTMKADFGGTQILDPLKHILGSKPSSGQRQVFVLTDGQVANENEVFNLLGRECSSGAVRVFSLGVGANVSHHLVEGMARAGKGTSMFVTGGATEIRTKVLRQLKQALQPSLTDTSATWNFAQPHPPADPAPAPARGLVKTLLGYRSPDVDLPVQKPDPVPRVFPSITPPVLNHERFISFALFPKGEMELPESVTIKAQTPDGPLEVTLPLGEEEVVRGTVAHRLAAKLAIRESEEGFGRGRVSKGEALQFALTHGLASQQTSFVAVRREPTSSATAPMTTTVIPQQPLPDPPELFIPHHTRFHALTASSRARSASDGREVHAAMAQMAQPMMAQCCASPVSLSAPLQGGMKMAKKARDGGVFGGGGGGGGGGVIGGGGGGGGGGVMMRMMEMVKGEPKLEKKMCESVAVSPWSVMESAPPCAPPPSCSIQGMESAAARHGNERAKKKQARKSPVESGSAQSNEEDSVLQLCMLQRADGSFPLDALASWMGVTPAQLEATLAALLAALLPATEQPHESSTLATVAA